MTDQTPSTEDVRYGYRTGVTAPILPVEAGDAFDAWLAARDREVAAKALREFADAVRMPFTVFRGDNGHPITVGDLLRETANRIEAGDE